MVKRTIRIAKRTRAFIASENRKILDEQTTSKKMAELYQLQSKQIKATDGFKKYEIRKKLIQNLDKANKKASEEDKIKNTLKFFEETINLLTQEYNQLKETKEINDLDLIDLAKSYVIHTKIFKRFDANTELNPDLGYNVKLNELLTEKLNELNENFIQYFNLEISVVLSL